MLRLLRPWLRPLARAVTYTRWLHLLMGMVVAVVCAFVFTGLHSPSPAEWALTVFVVPVPLLVAAAMVPAVRRAEGLQARLMLFPGAHARVSTRDAHARVRDAHGHEDPGVSTAPAASWRDRGRTAVWLVLRLEAGSAMWFLTTQLLGYSLALVDSSAEEPDQSGLLLPTTDWAWANALLVPVPALALLGVVVVAGKGMALAARRFLGPSPAERLAALETRTEQLLQRNRIARDLHDSIGHALTVAVVQAGAARAAGDPDFSDRALEAIEETGRAALEDLDRVLRVLREEDREASAAPTLADAERLLDSARASGAEVDVEVSGPVERVPGPVSREGYRMLQESLTNVLRHSGPVPVQVRITVDGARLDLSVRNALPPGRTATGRAGSGLRGVRERATLLGGRATTGPHGDDWRVHVELPLG
ncbi:sensor histidine kinase [Streptomyces sp. NPDC059009]|uniref:sensor histidine kinase n=1 Tax=Streptomyces sp. NPDC059009 TaxID=3346694 RepID=UPI0036B79084